MSDFEMSNFNQQREKILEQDRRFETVDNKLNFEGVQLEALAKKYGTPLYVYSEHEIIRNIREIEAAFSAHKNTKTFFASKACSVMSVLKAIKDAGIYAEANSMYEVRKCLEIGFPGSQIVFNGVVKKPADLEFAIANDLYLINV
ncbi:MAG: diaminopimelate decarboxylase, partial [Plesiomonas sp.]